MRSADRSHLRMIEEEHENAQANRQPHQRQRDAMQKPSKPGDENEPRADEPNPVEQPDQNPNQSVTRFEEDDQEGQSAQGAA